MVSRFSCSALMVWSDAEDSALKVFIIEQTDGLRTHCPSAYALYHSIFDGTPYCLYHSTVDAAACGGTHSRERLIWVAVR